MPSVASWRKWKRLFAASDDPDGARTRDLLARLDPAALARLKAEWPLFARDDQLPPGSFSTHPVAREDWRTWLFMGGRGAGKTRAGAEWVRGLVEGREGFSRLRLGRIALVGETHADVREVMVEGPSGLTAVAPPGERPRWEASRRRLVWPNGAVAQGFSSEDPEALRGPQFEAAWCDEAGKWRHARETWDMLQFGLRLGACPRACVTTTPRPTPLIRAMLAEAGTVLTRAATRDNAANLSQGFIAAIAERYAGTRLGRQELDGELIEDRADALFSRVLIEAARLAPGAVPALTRIVVAVDPPATSGRRADACGIVAAGIDANRTVHVLEDATLERAKPAEWAARAVALYHRLAADALVAEVNQGGEMVEAVLRETDPSVPVTSVRATRGKVLRAEPVAALYAQGRVRHAGAFPALEDEMCDFPLPEGSGRSPDRLDALVWAVTALTLTPRGEPRVRGL
jgi:phage terminase large subunit-like protein